VKWWGPNITSTTAGTSTAAVLAGEMWNAAYELCPQAEYTGITLEFGTVALEETFAALRADQWLEMHPEAEPSQGKAIKQRLRDAFYVDTEAWKQALLEQGRRAAIQACRGLAS
jgi:hypothetical protein